MDYSIPAAIERQERTAQNLEKNGFSVILVANAEEAKQKILSMIPKDSQIMNMTSCTLDTLGVPEMLAQSGRYQLVRDALNNPETAPREKKRLGAAPEWTIGSIHALTEDGHALIASNTGSQLPAYVYGADHVVWVVGAQKIVGTIDEGIQRIYAYVVPLEDQRALQAYGVHTAVNNLLIINANRAVPGRITILLVNEALGF